MLATLILGCAHAVAQSPISATDPPSWNVVVSGTTLPVQPPVAVLVTDEAKVLPAVQPSWNQGAKLDECRVIPPDYYHCCHSVLVPGSVVLKSARGDLGQRFELGRDYLLDELWASLGRIATGAIAEGQVVFADYRVGLQRVDTIVEAPSGEVFVLAGGSARSAPVPPPVPAGWTLVGHLWVRGTAEALLASDIFPDDTEGSAAFEAAWRASETQVGPGFVRATLAKLRAGEPVTVVCLGDSVTAAADLPSPEGQGYVARLERALNERFPRSKVRVINAGIGGTPSAYGLERLDRDVLAHQPDLVTIMFPLNDCGTPKERFAENLRELTRRCHAAGAEVIHMTSNFMTAAWFGNLASVNETVREVARETGTGLADAYRRWEQLRFQGLPYETLLLNTINHPDYRGHAFFLEELLRFFPAED